MGLNARNGLNRYLYNGKELQVGTGYVEYGARMYMPEIGRWGVVDSKAYKYSNNSPYNYVLNRPLIAIDPDGNEIIFVVRGKDNKSYRTLTYKGGSAYWNDTGEKYDGRGANNTIYRVLKAYKRIEQSEDKVLKSQLSRIETSELIHFVSEGKNGSKVSGEGPRNPSNGREGTNTEFDFSEKTRQSDKVQQGIPQSDLADVVHELSHQYDHETGNTKDDKVKNSATDPSEIRAVKNENRARTLEGLPKRTTYGKQKIDPKKLNK